MSLSSFVRIDRFVEWQKLLSKTAECCAISMAIGPHENNHRLGSLSSEYISLLVIKGFIQASIDGQTEKTVAMTHVFDEYFFSFNKICVHLQRWPGQIPPWRQAYRIFLQSHAFGWCDHGLNLLATSLKSTGGDPLVEAKVLASS